MVIFGLCTDVINECSAKLAQASSSSDYRAIFAYGVGLFCGGFIVYLLLKKAKNKDELLDKITEEKVEGNNNVL